MIVIHKGFDGLDLSLQGHISPDFNDALADAKERAADSKHDVLLDYNGVKMHVSETGAKGGYVYRCSTGEFGATWFFKKPNAKDAWGIRVSFNAMGLACNGLGAARSQLYSVLERLEIRTSALGVSIGRVDFAIDFYAPDFELIPDNFVMHSNAVRSDHYDALTLQSEGTSRRVTTVRVGKMPGRQVTIYDKRAEVIVKRKPGWWVIWNGNLTKLGLPPLDPSGDPASNRVWRVELRAGKKHLKNRWGITTWADLDDKLGDVYNKMLDDIRYCEPTFLDKNRSRWPPAPIWEQAKSEIQYDLSEMVSGVEPNNIKAVHKAAHRQMLVAQTSGLITSIAALDGTNFVGYPNTVDQVSRLIIASARNDQTRIENGIEKAKNRYVFLDDT